MNHDSLRIGKKYKVVSGSGLDSGRVGKLVEYPGESRLRKDEPGRYKTFDSSREAVLIDDNGKYFSMFKNRLTKVTPRRRKIVPIPPHKEMMRQLKIMDRLFKPPYV